MLFSNNRRTRTRRDLRFRPELDVLSDRIAPSGLQLIPMPENDPYDDCEIECEYVPEPVNTDDDNIMLIDVGMI